MTDKELWQAAWKELTRTTDSYPTWKKKGFPASSHWAKAKALGDQIGPPSPPALSVSSSITEGQTLTAPVVWEATPSGGAASSVEFSIDGAVRWTENIAPYQFNGDGNKLDPATLTNGPHTFAVTAHGYGGEQATATANATVNVPVTPPLPPQPTPSGPTRTQFAAIGDTSLDPVMNTGDPSWKKYVKDQYACLIEVWVDRWLDFGVPTFFYVDAQAVYAQPGADMSIVLKNSTGKPLYIDWGCSGGTCPQWAGDIGSPAYRQQYIARCQQHVAAGHKGIFMDDVNLGFNMTPGSGGGSSTPINPRTGAAYDSTTYKADWASFLETVRVALPNTKIAHNSRWFDSANHDGKEPAVERQILACDYVNMERGVLDGGIHVGTDEWSIKRYFDFVDHVHSLGRSVVWMSYADNDKDAKATLAAYLVMRDQADMIATRTNSFPPTPYGPYQVDPGAAQGPRTEISPYVWQRKFKNATVVYDHNTRTGTVS